MIKTSQPHTIIAGFGPLVTPHDCCGDVGQTHRVAYPSIDSFLYSVLGVFLYGLRPQDWPHEYDVELARRRDGRSDPVRTISVNVRDWVRAHDPDWLTSQQQRELHQALDLSLHTQQLEKPNDEKRHQHP